MADDEVIDLLQELVRQVRFLREDVQKVATAVEDGLESVEQTIKLWSGQQE